MPWALIINTFTNVLSELFLKLVCIIFYYFFYFINFMFRNNVGCGVENIVCNETTDIQSTENFTIRW